MKPDVTLAEAIRRDILAPRGRDRLGRTLMGRTRIAHLRWVDCYWIAYHAIGFQYDEIREMRGWVDTWSKRVTLEIDLTDSEWEPTYDFSVRELDALKRGEWS
jgi:hypothetical protein